MSIFGQLPEVSIYFSKSIGLPILDSLGKKIGTLVDYFVDFEEIYPQVFAIQIKSKKNFYYVYWSEIKNFSLKKVQLSEKAKIKLGKVCPRGPKTSSNILKASYKNEVFKFPSLGKVILDKQIVDTYGKKVVRVNDLQFIKSGPNLRITHVAIGFRSIIRRLGFENIMDFFIKKINKNSNFLNRETLINWKYVHAVPDKNLQSHIKLNLSNDQLNDIHPADLADILEDLDAYGRKEVFNHLGTQTAAQTLSEIESDFQANLIKEKAPDKVAKIIETLGTDEAADILNELDDEKADEIISNLNDNELQEDLHELLEYNSDTAGGLMSTKILTVNGKKNKSEILTIIKENYKGFDSIYDIFVVNKEDSLLGTCSLQKLLIQNDFVPIEDFMTKTEKIITFFPNTPWKELAKHMSKYNKINIPITNKNNTLLGIVSVDDVLPWLLN